MMAADMAAGRWQLTHQGIAIGPNGEVIDGQHRLHAVVLSGVTVMMLVTYNVPVESVTVIDVPILRQVKDAFWLSNHKDLLHGAVGENTAAAMWARMIYGVKPMKGRETRSELIAFALEHAEAGRFALSVFTRRGQVSVAPVLAAVARAYYHYPEKARLVQFAEVLTSGRVDDPESDDAAITLRNYLLASSRLNSNMSHIRYGKAARAIQAFMDLQPMSKLYVPEQEPFPLPHATAIQRDLFLDPRSIDRTVAQATSH
jgi:hypothetical protein